ncbi:MAG: SusD/RagB family nutrient-binding outer membrane lipoprotein [Ginsengibacter sp.]
MKKYSIITGLFLLVFTIGCKKYLDINANPNAANEPPISGLLANTTYTTSINTYNVGDWVSYYSQYFASPGNASPTDIYDETDRSGAWGGIYNVLTDLYDMRKMGKEKGWNAYVGIADIASAINLSMGMNVWGDMPFSEAFVGVNNLVPKFTTDKVLYDSCIVMLDRGISLLQQPGIDGQLKKASDFIHKGVLVNWVKTGYALKARLLNQISKKSEYSATAVLAAIDKAYTTNADDAQVTQFTIRNPYAGAAIANRNLNLDVWLSENFIEATNGVTYGLFDPRLPQITIPTEAGKYQGVTYPAGGYRCTPNGAGYQGEQNTKHVQNYLEPGKWYSNTNSPLQIITNAEMRFVEAEAAFRASNKDRAYTAYLAGISASMEKLNVAAGMITDYINNPIVAVGKDNLTLALIMKEKYLACFLMPVTWDDLRRFDYNMKNFTLPKNVILPTFIRRANYPSATTSRNGENVPAVERTDRLWWDK